MLKNKITNIFIVLFLIGLLFFAFFLINEREKVEKEYFSEIVFNQIYKEIMVEKKNINNETVTEKHLLLKENENFNLLKKKT